MGLSENREQKNGGVPWLKLHWLIIICPNESTTLIYIGGFLLTSIQRLYSGIWHFSDKQRPCNSSKNHFCHFLMLHRPHSFKTHGTIGRKCGSNVKTLCGEIRDIPILRWSPLEPAGALGLKGALGLYDKWWMYIAISA